MPKYTAGPKAAAKTAIPMITPAIIFQRDDFAAGAIVALTHHKEYYLLFVSKKSYSAGEAEGTGFKLTLIFGLFRILLGFGL